MPAEAIRINRRVLLQCSIGAPGLKQPFAQPQQNGALSALRTLPPTAANGRYLRSSACSNFGSFMAPLSLSALVVHLFEAVVSLIVTPIDEDRSLIDTRAILAPTFKSHMGLGQGSYGRSLPSEVTLGAICAYINACTTFTVSFAASVILAGIANIKDAN